MFKLQKKIKIEWSPNFAYAIGLIASDGSLNGDGRHIKFVSAEREMIDNFRKALLINNKVGTGTNGPKTSKYLYISFGDKNFYKFLNSIGLTKAKSKTIKAVSIPKKYFPDFLRGLYDGDGSFYTFWDKRWPNSFGYVITFASASLKFITWLKEKTSKVCGVKGFIRQGKGVYEIRYLKGDSVKLYNFMYYKKAPLLLSRKRDRIQNAINFDLQNKSLASRASSAVRALP